MQKKAEKTSSVFEFKKSEKMAFISLNQGLLLRRRKRLARSNTPASQRSLYYLVSTFYHQKANQTIQMKTRKASSVSKVKKWPLFR